jgi:catechol 2,3-dioxygenase-like lactoylglutathione lyase family enzyme
VKPNFIRVTPVMAVPTLEAGLRFFCTLLDFQSDFVGGGYAYVYRDTVAVRLMDHTLTDGAAPGNRRYGIYIDVEDVDAVAAAHHERLAAAGILTHGPADKPYGQREYCVEAPDGNLVVFGQTLDA